MKVPLQRASSSTGRQTAAKSRCHDRFLLESMSLAQESLIPASARPVCATQLAVHNLKDNSGPCALGGVRLAGLAPALFAG